MTSPSQKAMTVTTKNDTKVLYTTTQTILIE